MADEIDVGGIVLRIRADMAGVKQGVDQLVSEMARTKGATDATGAGVEASSKRMASAVKSGSLEQAAAYAAIAAAATKAMSMVLGAIDTGITAINKYRAAVVGLNSIAAGNGIPVDQITSALGKVTDAFFDVASASTAFKNLIARGYNVDQATQSILRLKDAAAFGRQASLGLADAVVSATEGLKNENSILVDNAGVTKNVSKMWDDYAKAIGTSTEKLTKQQKIEAEVAGIMQETRFQVGDLAKLQLTLAGTQAATALAGEDLARAYGDSLSPAVGLVTMLWGEFLKMLTLAVNEFPGLIAGLTGAGLAIGAFVVAQKAAMAVQALSLALNAATGAATIFGMSMSVAMPILGAIALAVGIATALYTNYAKSQEDAAQKVKETAAAEKERQAALQTTTEDLQRLGSRFEELSNKTNLTYAESNELLEIERTLKEQYGITGSALDTLAGKYGTVTEAIRAKRIETLLDLQDSKIATAQQAKDALDAADLGIVAAQKYSNLTKRAAALKVELDTIFKASGLTDLNKFIKTNVQGFDLAAEIDDLERQKQRWLDAAKITPEDFAGTGATRSDAAAAYVKAQIDVITSEYEIGGGKVDKATKGIVDSLFLSLAAAPRNGKQADVGGLMDIYAAAIRSADIGAAVAAMDEVQRKILIGGELKEEDKSAIQTSWNAIVTYAEQVGAALGMNKEEVAAFAATLAPVMTTSVQGVEDLSTATDTMFSLWKNQTVQGFVGQTAEEMKKALSDMSTSVEAETKRLNAMGSSLRGETGIIAALELLKKAMDEEDPAMLDLAIKGLESLGMEAPKGYARIEESLESHRAYRANLVDEMGDQMRSLNEMQASFEAKQAALVSEGKRATPEFRALDAYIERIKEAKRVAGYDAEYKGLNLVAPGAKGEIDATTASMEDLIDAQTQYDKQMKSAEETLAEYNKQMAALQTLQAGYASGDTTSQSFKDAEAYLKTIPEFAYMAIDSMDVLTQQIELQGILISGTQAEIEEVTARSQALLDTLKAKLAGMKEGTAEYTQLNGLIVSLERIIELGGMIGAGTDFVFTAGLTGGEAVLQTIKDISAKAANAQAAIQNIGIKRAQIVDAQKMVAETKRLQKAGKDVSDEWRKGVSKALGYDFKGSLEEAIAAMNGMDISLQGLIDSMTAELEAAKQQLADLATGVVAGTIDVTINGTVDISAMMENINAAIDTLNAGLLILGASPLTQASGSGRSGGGGGGGGSKTETAPKNNAFANALAALNHQVAMGRKSLEGELKALLALQKKYKATMTKDERLALEEQIYNIREQIRQKNLDADYRAIQHKLAMGQISTAEEIEMLKKIALENKLNAQEKMDLAEQIYEAEERLRQERLNWDLALLNHQVAMGQIGVQQEIARLEEIKLAHEMNAEEIMSIDEQIYTLQQQLIQEQENQVKTVYDHIVTALKNRLNEQKQLELQALNDRIEQLNALTKAENEAKKKDDYEQKLADKERELSVTKSARRRRELEAELAEMAAAEALRLAQEARQAEIDAINAQKDGVNTKYEELMKEENLRQEALRMVMSNNLEQMTELIASYGEPWRDAGAQLAEALTQGLVGNSGAIIDTIAAINDAIQQGISDQLTGIGANLPRGTLGGINITISSMIVRDDTDIEAIADELYGRIQAEGR